MGFCCDFLRAVFLFFVFPKYQLQNTWYTTVVVCDTKVKNLFFLAGLESFHVRQGVCVFQLFSVQERPCSYFRPKLESLKFLRAKFLRDVAYAVAQQQQSFEEHPTVVSCTVVWVSGMCYVQQQYCSRMTVR